MSIANATLNPPGLSEVVAQSENMNDQVSLAKGLSLPDNHQTSYGKMPTGINLGRIRYPGT